MVACAERTRVCESYARPECAGRLFRLFSQMQEAMEAERSGKSCVRLWETSAPAPRAPRPPPPARGAALNSMKNCKIYCIPSNFERTDERLKEKSLLINTYFNNNAVIYYSEPGRGGSGALRSALWTADCLERLCECDVRKTSNKNKREEWRRQPASQSANGM